MRDTPDGPLRLTPIGRFALLSLLYILPLFVVLALFGYYDQGAGAAICAGIVAVAVRPWWGQRRKAWFWATVVLAGLAQIPVVLYAPWSSHSFRGGVALGFAIVDYCIVHVLMRIALKVNNQDGKWKN